MRERVEEMLTRRGVDPAFLRAYDAPDRFYHTWAHIEEVLTLMRVDVDSDADYPRVLAALFHDAWYVPGEPDNEELSARLFDRTVTSGLTPAQRLDVRAAITDTRDHLVTGDNPVSISLCDADMHSLQFGGVPQLAANERKIMLEFQRFPYAKYKEGRLAFLRGAAERYRNPAILSLVDLVEHRRVRVAVLTHGFSRDDASRDLVSRLERTFDKVVLAMHIPWHARSHWVGALDEPGWSHYERHPWSAVSELASYADPDYCTHVVAYNDARLAEATTIHDMLLRDGRCPVMMVPERLSHRRFSDDEAMHLI